MLGNWVKVTPLQNSSGLEPRPSNPQLTQPQDLGWTSELTFQQS